jgi:hypothetical protein
MTHLGMHLSVVPAGGVSMRDMMLETGNLKLGIGYESSHKTRSLIIINIYSLCLGVFVAILVGLSGLG